MFGIPHLTPPEARRAFRNALVLLLALDLLLIGAYVAASAMVARGALEDVPFMLRISSDGSLGEIVSYGEWLTIALCMAALWRRRGDRLARSMAWVFAIILADDMLQLHETLGDAIGAGLGPRFGLAGDDQGELLTWAALGVVVAWLLFRGFRRARREDIPLGIAMTVTLAALVFVAAGLDMLVAVSGVALGGGTGDLLAVTLSIVEDGGEMVVGSFGCALAWGARAGVTGPARRG